MSSSARLVLQEGGLSSTSNDPPLLLILSRSHKVFIISSPVREISTMFQCILLRISLSSMVVPIAVKLCMLFHTKHRWLDGWHEQDGRMSLFILIDNNVHVVLCASSLRKSSSTSLKQWKLAVHWYHCIGNDTESHRCSQNVSKKCSLISRDAGHLMRMRDCSPNCRYKLIQHLGMYSNWIHWFLAMLCQLWDMHILATRR